MRSAYSRKFIIYGSEV